MWGRARGGLYQLKLLNIAIFGLIIVAGVVNDRCSGRRGRRIHKFLSPFSDVLGEQRSCIGSFFSSLSFSLVSFLCRVIIFSLPGLSLLGRAPMYSCTYIQIISHCKNRITCQRNFVYRLYSYSNNFSRGFLIEDLIYLTFSRNYKVIFN